MSSGGKGGKNTTTVELDPRLEEGAVNAMAGALASAGLDYSPNRGTTIAAFSPQQMAAFQGANQAAGAFGLPTGGEPANSMPTPEMGASGVLGYSTGGQYDANIAASVSPEQQAERQGILDYFGQSGMNLGKQTEAGQQLGLGEGK